MEFLGLSDLYFLMLFGLHFQVTSKCLVCGYGSGKGKALHMPRDKVERIRRNLSCWLGWETLVRGCNSLSRECPRAGKQQPGVGSC